MLVAHAREEERMRRVLATLVALSLLMSMFTGVFAPVPEARADDLLPVNLGTAGKFVVLAETAITTTGATLIPGDIGISPYAASALTGFGQKMDPSGTFSTSPQVTGKVYAADYTEPTPHYMTTAVNDMMTAYKDAAGRPNPTATELGAGNIGGMTFDPGVYKWSTNVTIPTDIALDAHDVANAVWIFQIAGDLNIASKGSIGEGIKVNLVGGAQASNVFWQVQGSNFGATLGTYSTFSGNILSAKQIIMETGAKLNGRALAQTQVTLDGNTGSAPTSADVAITKTADNAAPLVGSNVTFTLTVTNNGPSGATGVSVNDTLPAGFTYVSSTPSGAYNSTTHVWTVGTLMNGASAILGITATVTQPGAITNTATVPLSPTDSVPANNTASTIVTGIILTPVP